MHRQYLFAAHAPLLINAPRCIRIFLILSNWQFSRCRHRVSSTPGPVFSLWTGWFALHQRFFASRYQRNRAKYRPDCLRPGRRGEFRAWRALNRKLSKIRITDEKPSADQKHAFIFLTSCRFHPGSTIPFSLHRGGWQQTAVSPAA